MCLNVFAVAFVSRNTFDAVEVDSGGLKLAQWSIALSSAPPNPYLPSAETAFAAAAADNAGVCNTDFFMNSGIVAKNIPAFQRH